MTGKKKPKVFVGSSRETVEYADAIHELLSFHAEVTPWSAGVFKGMSYPMESLEKQLSAIDFAVFLFSPDDLATIRDHHYFIPRDNLLFELGLFWGKIGRDRVFCLIPEQVPKIRQEKNIGGYRIPTDLAGLTTLTYENRSDGNFQAAVNVACRQIIKRIQQLGPFSDPNLELEHLRARAEDDYKLIRFLRRFAKDLLKDPEKKYDLLSEGLWSAFSPPETYTVEGIGIYRAEQPDGLRHIAGNEGRGKFYPFNVNDGRKEDERIVVVDCFLKNEEQVLQKHQYIDYNYVFCYPIEKELVITISITGRNRLSAEDIDDVFLHNHDLIKAVHYLFGGKMDEQPFQHH